MNTNTFDLSISYDECKAKTTEVASFIFAEYDDGENNNANTYRITGLTSDSRAMLVCMKKNQGVRFVVIASSDGFQNEQKTIVERISKFMNS